MDLHPVNVYENNQIVTTGKARLMKSVISGKYLIYSYYHPSPPLESLERPLELIDYVHTYARGQSIYRLHAERCAEWPSLYPNLNYDFSSLGLRQQSEILTISKTQKTLLQTQNPMISHRHLLSNIYILEWWLTDQLILSPWNPNLCFLGAN